MPWRPGLAPRTGIGTADDGPAAVWAHRGSACNLSCGPFAGRAPVAQRIEHLTTDQKVGGSSPFGRTDERRSTAAVLRLFGVRVRVTRQADCPVALRTSSATRFSSAGDSSVIANAVGHREPSSSWAPSKKPRLP